MTLARCACVWNAVKMFHTKTACTGVLESCKKYYAEFAGCSLFAPRWCFCNVVVFARGEILISKCKRFFCALCLATMWKLCSNSRSQRFFFWRRFITKVGSDWKLTVFPSWMILIPFIGCVDGLFSLARLMKESRFDVWMSQTCFGFKCALCDGSRK